MKKSNIVQKNTDFSKIINQGTCVKDKNLVIYALNNDLLKARFGLSVGTKIGKAHLRNKFKRQLRNIVDNYKNSYSKSKDYIIIVRKGCLDSTFQEIEKSYRYLMEKLNNNEGRKHEK